MRVHTHIYKSCFAQEEVQSVHAGVKGNRVDLVPGGSVALLGFTAKVLHVFNQSDVKNVLLPLILMKQ